MPYIAWNLLPANNLKRCFSESDQAEQHASLTTALNGSETLLNIK